MHTAGKDKTNLRLLITGPKATYFTLKNDASPWQHDHPPLLNSVVSTTPTARIIAALLLRYAGTSCTLTCRPGTEEL